MLVASGHFSRKICKYATLFKLKINMKVYFNLVQSWLKKRKKA